MHIAQNAAQTKFRQRGLPVLFFVLALAVRLPALDTFLTYDEPVWLARSNWFLTGLINSSEECPPDRDGRDYDATGLICTFQPSYPGVTTMWSGTLGLLLHFLQNDGEQPDLQTALQNYRVFTADVRLIGAVRLPTVILVSLFIGLFYGLARRLFSRPVAIIATLLLALSPFQAAQSRVLHTDALITAFMVLSVLALLGYWLQNWQRRWLAFSGVMAGLTFLTKPIGWFLLPGFAMFGLFTVVYRWQSKTWQGWVSFVHLLRDGLIWGFTAGLTIFLLFPALWVIPGEIIRTSLNVASGMALAGHPHFFWGEPTNNPGPLFYVVGWLFSASPLQMLGLTGVGIFGAMSLWRDKVQFLRRQIIAHPIELALLLFTVSFFLFVTASPKKMVRYMLPVFPIINIFVAYGLLWLWRKLTRPNFTSGLRRRNGVLYGVVFVVQGWLILTSFPYYFSYFNPLLGGGSVAQRVMGFSWGEGFDRAAAFLNEQPAPENLTVTVCRGKSMLTPFFSGNAVLPCAKVEQILDADYTVYYLWTRQVYPTDYYWPYFRDHQTPVYRSTISGVDYALVYARPYQHSVSAADNRLDGLFTAYGFNFDAGLLTLVWHNVGLTEQQPWLGLAQPNADATTWLPCQPAPGFENAAITPDSIVESVCRLNTAAIVPGLYDMQLAVGSNARSLRQIPSSGLAFVQAQPGSVALIESTDYLAQVAGQSLPATTTPTDITFGSGLRLAGYETTAKDSSLILYWQPRRRPDPGLVQALTVELHLLTANSTAVTHPILTAPVSPEEIARGELMPMTYPLLSTGELPTAVTLCVKITAADQIVPATGPGDHTEAGCTQLPLSQPSQPGTKNP